MHFGYLNRQNTPCIARIVSWVRQLNSKGGGVDQLKITILMPSFVILWFSLIDMKLILNILLMIVLLMIFHNNEMKQIVLDIWTLFTFNWRNKEHN